MYSILLLEDDLLFASSIEDFLVCEGFCVDIAKDGEEVFDFTFHKNYDLYIFDINVPNIDGLYLLEHIKNINPNSKVIMISANINIDQIKEAYLKGCDDYIKKPFDIEELLLKINKYTQKPHIIILDENLYFNKNDKKLFLNNIEIELTKNERNLLILLINNKSNKVSHSQIEDYIYDRVSKSSDAIRSLVKRLRRKITKDIIFNSLDEGYYIK